MVVPRNGNVAVKILLISWKLLLGHQYAQRENLVYRDNQRGKARQGQPQRPHEGHPYGMMIQSELPGNR